MGPNATKYIAVLYGPWGFQKCIWEPQVTKFKFYTEVKLSWNQFRVKFGLCNLGFPYAFSESPRSME